MFNTNKNFDFKTTATTLKDLKKIENLIPLDIELLSYECKDEPVNGCILLRSDFIKDNVPYSTIVHIHDQNNVTVADVTHSFQNCIEDLEEKIQENHWDGFIAYVSSIIYNKHTTQFRKLGDRSPDLVFPLVKDYVKSLKNSGLIPMDVYLTAMANSEEAYNNAVALA